MKLLFLDQYGEMGGAQRCFLDLAPILLESGWEIRALLPQRGDFAEALRQAGVEVTGIDIGPFGQGRKSAGDVMRYVRQKRPLREIVKQALAEKPAVMLVNGPRVLQAAASIRDTPPIVFHCHHFLESRFLRAVVRRWLRYSGAAAVCPSRFLADQLEGETHIIPNACPDLGFTPGTRTTEGLTVGLIGRIMPQKGQAVLVEAVRRIRSRITGLRAVICGDTRFHDMDAARYDESLRHEAVGLPVRFLGWQKNPASVLRSLDLLVVPSTVAEGSPRVILEAWSVGTPVLAVASGGIAELIEHRRTGWLIEHAVPSLLAEGICDFHRLSPAERGAIAVNARRVWEQHHTLKRYSESMLAVLERATGSGAPE